MKWKMMKYKFITSLIFFALYGSTACFLLALSQLSIYQASFSLVAACFFYKISSNIVYFTKEWIKGSMITFFLLFTMLLVDTEFVAYAIAISFLAATFIQVFLDEMCRSKEI